MCLNDSVCNADDQRVVVLRNGAVLSGTIVETDRQYLIYPNPNSELRLDKNRVDFVAESLESAYKIKAATLVGVDYARRVELAKWCLRHKLLEPLRKEISQLRPEKNQDPEVARLVISEKRLAQTLKLEKTWKPRESEVAEPKKEMTDFEKAFNEATIPEISAVAYGKFVREIQPRLLNGCAAAGCHGTKSETSFKLLANQKSSLLPRRSIMFNLSQTYDLIKMADKELNGSSQSKLLKYSSKVHANLKRPVYRLGSEHYNALANWINEISAEASMGKENLIQLAGFEQVENTSEAAILTEMLDGYTPRDRHDPEIFNRLVSAKESEKQVPEEVEPELIEPREIVAPKRLGANRPSTPVSQAKRPIIRQGNMPPDLNAGPPKLTMPSFPPSMRRKPRSDLILAPSKELDPNVTAGSSSAIVENGRGQTLTGNQSGSPNAIQSEALTRGGSPIRPTRLGSPVRTATIRPIFNDPVEREIEPNFSKSDSGKSLKKEPANFDQKSAAHSLTPLNQPPKPSAIKSAKTYRIPKFPFPKKQ